MKIYVTSALGSGKTMLAAFDQALMNTGTANYNLIRLSSVIPTGAEVVESQGPMAPMGGDWGDRLYVVYAEARTEHMGQEVWAGVGWVQDTQTGKGLFVEHEGNSEQQVRTDITSSLQGLLQNRNMAELPIHMNVVGGVCQSEPICAFAVAAYQVSDWHNQAYLQN